MPQLPPGTPFKGKGKGIPKSCQRLAAKLFLKIHRKLHAWMRSSNGIRTTSMVRNGPFARRTLSSTRRSNNQSDVMELGKRRRMANKRHTGMLTASGSQNGASTKMRNRLTA
jgi:hypothetical protein